MNIVNIFKEDFKLAVLFLLLQRAGRNEFVKHFFSVIPFHVQTWSIIFLNHIWGRNKCKS